ncbi:MAG: tail fiber protein [Prolixibacteraceae bacterium]
MDAFFGEIRAFANSFYPDGWLPCNGQQVPLQQYAVLYSLIGTYYGPSDGRSYFTLPDLRGSALVGTGPAPGSAIPFDLGDVNGTEKILLTTSAMPVHDHDFGGAAGGAPTARQSTADNATSHISNFLYQAEGSTALVSAPAYLDRSQTPVLLNAGTVVPSGGASAHENRQPFLVIGYYICATDGYYPERP